MASEGEAATGSSGGATRTLEDTPTWALATVCFVFISISIFIEYLIHLLANWLKKHRKTSLLEAVEKLKSVLIVLGFMSLILTVTQKSISKICVPTKVANTMLPCRQSSYTTKTTKAFSADFIHQRNLASDDDDDDDDATKYLSSTDYCQSKGMTSLISEKGVTQLSILIFVLAVMQIIYCVLTMALGRAKMKRWKAWEEETQTIEYMVANDSERFRFTRQTTFARRHMSSCTDSFIYLWIKCFFRQFFNSVAKVDYLTLRHGFITAHFSTNNYFNFQNYIQRSLEDDFKLVVGISPFMWLLMVILMLVDVQGWHVFLWVSFVPLTIVLVLGTKLQVIVARMALELQNQNSVTKGAPTVQPNDNLFWFNHPKYVLTLLHYTLFVNAFELAFFVWVTLEYGIHSCYHERTDIIIIRLVLAVTVQVMCSYITLPLYALVTQMGSTFKSAVLNEKTSHALNQWHAGAKSRMKKQQGISKSVHDISSTVTAPIWTSNRTSTSQDLSPHHRTPTLGEITTFPEKSEITEDDHHGSTTPIWTSNGTSTSQDLSPHHRTPTLGEITTFPEKSEITEDDHHGSTSVGTSNNEVQVEIPEIK
ncbi:hypothetical protein LWI28_003965 [Acer negundo]|uniref:MLO-like protein n=1 Tax=Acer negundo TaxID=4023 RepID=A0AAD5JJ43_ACENE|nr:hypothetical protein LWI28_003965 [Acer negundo]